MKPLSGKSRLRRGSASIYKYIKREQFIREPCKCDKQILETAETKIIWVKMANKSSVNALRFSVEKVPRLAKHGGVFF